MYELFFNVHCAFLRRCCFLRILEEVAGSKAVVALFDDNMVIVEAVYEYLQCVYCIMK